MSTIQGPGTTGIKVRNGSDGVAAQTWMRLVGHHKLNPSTILINKDVSQLNGCHVIFIPLLLGVRILWLFLSVFLYSSMMNSVQCPSIF